MPDEYADIIRSVVGDDPNRKALANPRVRQFLDKIGRSEGADYNTLVGGARINDLSRHPNRVGLRTSAGPSTAFGKYQIVGSTDRSKLAKYRHLDYSPENQDLRAVELLRQTGALKALEQGDEATAIRRAGREWASIPGSPLPGRKNTAAFRQQKPQQPDDEYSSLIREVLGSEQPAVPPVEQPRGRFTAMADAQRTQQPSRRQSQPRRQRGQVRASGLGTPPITDPVEVARQVGGAVTDAALGQRSQVRDEIRRGIVSSNQQAGIRQTPEQLEIEVSRLAERAGARQSEQARMEAQRPEIDRIKAKLKDFAQPGARQQTAEGVFGISAQAGAEAGNLIQLLTGGRRGGGLTNQMRVAQQALAELEAEDPDKGWGAMARRVLPQAAGEFSKMYMLGRAGAGKATLPALGALSGADEGKAIEGALTGALYQKGFEKIAPLSRPVKAAIGVAGPTAVSVAQGEDPAKALVSNLAFAPMAIAEKVPMRRQLRPMPEVTTREAAPTLRPSELAKRVALRGDAIDKLPNQRTSEASATVARRQPRPESVLSSEVAALSADPNTRLSPLPTAETVVDAPVVRRGVSREIQTETQPPVEARVEGEKPAAIRGRTVAESNQPRMQSELEASAMRSQSPVESGTAASASVSAEGRTGAVSEPVKPQWQHRDFGLVSESTNQSGVGRGRVRVTAEDGSEHVIRRANLRGQGNNLAVPVRESTETPTFARERKQGEFQGLYHGSDAPIASFDLSKSRESGYSNLGVWLTDNPKAAAEYGKHQVRVNADIKNPLRYKSWNDFEEAIRSVGSSADLKTWAKSRGYDGLIIEGETDGYQQKMVVVFEPTRAQIATATPAAEGGQKPPPSPPSKGGEKQPWEMTQVEFDQQLQADRRAYAKTTPNVLTDIPNFHWRRVKLGEKYAEGDVMYSGKRQWQPEVGRKVYDSDYPAYRPPAIDHRVAVEAAIRDGKPVPESVLRDYPDLAAKVAPTTPPTTPAAPRPTAVTPPLSGDAFMREQFRQAKRQEVVDALARDESPYRGWDKDFPDLAAERRAKASVSEAPSPAPLKAFDVFYTTKEGKRGKVLGVEARTSQEAIEISKQDDPSLNYTSAKDMTGKYGVPDDVVTTERVPPLPETKAADRIPPLKPPPVEAAKAPERKAAELSLPKTLEKANLPGGKERFYDVKTDVESEARAKAIIKERGIEGARNWVQAGEQPSAEQSATAVELIKGLAHEAETAPADIKTAKLVQAGELASNMAVRAKEAGQFNQYFATLAKESPEGALYYAESRIKRQSPDARLTTEQRNGVFDTAVKLKATEAELDATRTKLADVERMLSEASKQPRREPQVTKRLRDWADQAEKDARARLAARTGVKGSEAGASTIPADIADYAIIGAAKMARGTANFADWSAQMVSEFGEDIKPQLRRIRAESERLVNEQSQLARHGKVVDEVARLGADADVIAAANKFVRGMSRTDFHREAVQSGLTRQQAHDLAVEGYKLYSDANRSLRQAGKERRAEKEEPDASPERRTELVAQRDTLMRQRAKERRELAAMMKQIEEGRPSVGRRLNNQFRGVIVSALQTASRNITTQVPRVVVEDMTKAFELSFVKGKAKLGWKLKEGDIDPRTRMLDTFKSSAYLLQRNKRVTEGILDEFPVEYEQMFRRFSSDVDITPQTGISKGVHKGLDKIDKAIEIVNTPNRFQEFLVRRAVFRGELEASLKAEGVDLNKVIAEGRQGEIDRAKVQRAVDEALRVTFADSPARGTRGDQFVSFFSSVPAPFNPLTFSRFLYNGAKFTLEYQPTTALRGLYRTARGKPGAASDYAKAAVGTVMLTTAVQVYDSMHKDGSEWYLLDLPGVGEIDIRPYQPFASYIFASHFLRTKQGGRPISYEGTRAGNVGTYVEGLTGLSARPVPVYEVAKAAVSEQQEWDGVLRQIKRVGGETVAGLLTPLKTPKQIIAQFDEQEAIVRDTSQHPITGPIRRNIPFASRGLPPLVRNEEVVTQPNPALQTLGVRTVMPDKRSEAEKFAQKLLRRDYTEARTDEEITRGKQTADLRARTRRGEAVDLSALPPRQRASIEKSRGLSRPEETFKRLGLEDLLKVWESNTPTAEEREKIIKPLLADKADAVDQLDESKQAAVKAQLRAIGIVPIEELPADKQREIVGKRRLENREQARQRREKQRSQGQRPSLGYGY